MKMDIEHYTKLKHAMMKYFNSMPADQQETAKTRARVDSVGLERFAWALFYKTRNDLAHDDAHPRFKDGTFEVLDSKGFLIKTVSKSGDVRICAQDLELDYYLSDLYDSHIKTAILKIVKDGIL